MLIIGEKHAVSNILKTTHLENIIIQNITNALCKPLFLSVGDTWIRSLVFYADLWWRRARNIVHW